MASLTENPLLNATYLWGKMSNTHYLPKFEICTILKILIKRTSWVLDFKNQNFERMKWFFWQHLIKMQNIHSKYHLYFPVISVLFFINWRYACFMLISEYTGSFVIILGSMQLTLLTSRYLTGDFKNKW